MKLYTTRKKLPARGLPRTKIYYELARLKSSVKYLKRNERTALYASLKRLNKLYFDGWDEPKSLRCAFCGGWYRLIKVDDSGAKTYECEKCKMTKEMMPR